MTDKTYKAALEAAKKELAALHSEEGDVRTRLDEITERLTNLRQSIAALSKLAGEEFDEEAALGLTDMIRQVLQEAGRSVNTQEIETMLESRGFNTRRYANLQASIITVVQRLTRQNQVAADGTIGNKTAYKWIGPKPQPVVKTIEIS